MTVNRTELRVCGKRSLRVTGHVVFRDDLHMPSRSEGGYLAHLLLAVEAAVRLGVRASRNRCRNSPRPHGGELRVLADLQTPALIIGQMPMQDVEFGPCHPVN